MAGLDQALTVLQRFLLGAGLAQRIAALESDLRNGDVRQLRDLLGNQGIDDEVVRAAITVKRTVGQINTLIHATGILVSLPHILEPGERILDLSLGAGNTGKDFDLETDRRVAEFKFIRWQGGSESIRQNSVFVALFKLAESERTKQKYLYVVDKAKPLNFLQGGQKGGRKIESVLSKNLKVSRSFRSKYGDQYTRVPEYYAAVGHLVNIVDLRDCVPGLFD